MSIQDCANVACALLSGEDAVIAVAIAGAESDYDPNAHGGPPAEPLDDSYGYWQINMIDDLGPARRVQFGINDNSDLYEPKINARAMAMISNDGSNWTPWTTYGSGAYLDFMDEARTAVANADPSVPSDPINTVPQDPPPVIDDVDPYSYQPTAKIDIDPDIVGGIVLAGQDESSIYCVVQLSTTGTTGSDTYLDTYSAYSDSSTPDSRVEIDISPFVSVHNWYHGEDDGYHGDYGQGFYGEQPVLDEFGTLWMWDYDSGTHDWVLYKGDAWSDDPITLTEVLRLAGTVSSIRMGYNPFDQSLYFTPLRPDYDGSDWQGAINRMPVDDEGTVYQVYWWLEGPGTYGHDGDYSGNFAFTPSHVWMAFQNHQYFAAEAMLIIPPGRTSATPGDPDDDPFYNNDSSIGFAEMCIPWDPHHVLAGGSGGANSSCYLFRDTGGVTVLGGGIGTAFEQNPGTDAWINRFTNKFETYLGPLTQTRAAQTPTTGILLLRDRITPSTKYEVWAKDTRTNGLQHVGGDGSGDGGGGTGTNGAASVIVPNAIAGAGQGTRAYWFEWNPPADSEVSFDTAGSINTTDGTNLPTVLALYSADDEGHVSSLQEIYSNASFTGAGTGSHLKLSTSSLPDTVYIAVASLAPSNKRVLYNLNYTFAPLVVADPNEPNETGAGDLISRYYQYEFKELVFGSGTSYMTEKVSGIHGMPGTDDNDLALGEHGSDPGLIRMQKRIIAFDMKIIGSKGTDIEEKLAIVRKTFQVPRIRNARYMHQLVFWRPGEPKKFMWVRCTKRDFPSDYDTARGLSSGSVELQATDPLIYDVTEKSNIGVYIPTGETSTSFGCISEGDFEDGTRPRFQIDGPCTNPRIANTDDDNRTIRIDVVLTAADSMILTRDKRVLIRTGLDGDWIEDYSVVRADNQWFKILPGLNTITFDRDAGNTGANGKITTYWRDAYA